MADAVDDADTADLCNMHEPEESLETEDLAIDESAVKSPDRPIVEGKRNRTAVKAFTSAPPVKEKKSLEFEVGQGTLLGQIDIVTEYMCKTGSEHYIALHKLMYNSQGVAIHRKKNVRRFNGFNFDADSKIYASKLASMRKMKSVDRKMSMKLLGLNQSSTIQDFMDFLMCPEDKGRHAPVKRKTKTPAKRKRSAGSKNGDEKATPPKKKNSPSPTKKQAKPRKKKKEFKKTDTDDELEIDDSLSESESVSDGNDQEDNNLIKKRKLSESITDISQNDSLTGPSDKELIASIKKTVDEIDLEEVSMREALKKIYDLYPSADLSERKSFIKDNIRKLVG